MSNVNNLNGVPNFGHGDDVVPITEEQPSIDEVSSSVDTEVSVKKPHKSKVKSAAKRAFGGKF